MDEFCTRHRTHTPLGLAGGATVSSTKPSRRKLPKKYTAILALSVLVVPALLFRDAVAWTWMNRFLYVGCPEYSFWLRRPHLKQKVVHLCAKFGPTKDEFAKDVEMHVKKVLRSGVFREEEIIRYTSFPSFITEDPTWNYHLQFLEYPLHKSRRGGGYWFWKPVLIRHHLRLLEDGDFLLYTDVDRHDFVSWTSLLLETMEDRDADLAIEQMSWPEKEWTKNDLYDSMCPGLLQKDDDANQYTGNFVLIQKNAQTVKFVDEWMEAAKNYHLISDEPSRKPNVARFRENRHDQSLLSLLIRCAHGEPRKTPFKWTCLGDWVLYTFQLHSPAK
jgi:hypothetical protein